MDKPCPPEVGALQVELLRAHEAATALRQQLAAAEAKAERMRAIADGHAEDAKWEFDRADRAEAERDRAVKDAERLDWLASHGASMRHSGGWYVLAPFHTGIPSVDDRRRFDTSRDAIDAAIAAAAGDAGGDHA